MIVAATGAGATSGVATVAQAAVPRGTGLGEWLFDADTWTGAGGILTSLADTVSLCAWVVAVAVVLGVPSASWLAHRRRGEVLAAVAVTVGRAVPTFAVAGLLVPLSLRRGWGFEPWPIFIALLLLAVPPIFLTTYTAVRQVEPGAVDAARAMGFSERSVLLRVELLLAAPVILAGTRVAAVQVVATEPLRAFLGGDGLGRYVRDGLGQNNQMLVVGGTILIASLAIATGLLFGAVGRFGLPAGVRRVRSGARRRARTATVSAGPAVAPTR
jgi:osmoprotectant transport system permease protein